MFNLPKKMIKTVFFLLFLFTSFLVAAQDDEQTTLAKFNILDASHNGVDVTPDILEAGAYTVFYTIAEDGLMYMANVWPNNESQSFGPMYGVQTEKVEETYENYAADYFYFNWRYNNTYNDESGTAAVEVIKIYKPQGVAFTIKIVSEELDVIIYKGYMEGTVDFSVYD